MMAKSPWRSRSMTPFSIPAERIPKCILGANLVILAQIHYRLSCRQAKLPRIPSQNGQNDLEGQSQWPPFSIPAGSIPGCMFGANLVILTQICDELLYGQSEFPRTLSQNGQIDLEGQSQWPPFSIPTKSIPGCMLGANLVILAQICDELSCGQAKFPRILNQNGQNDLESKKVNDLHFQYQPRVSQDACLVQIWWLQLKSVTSYRADKVKFTDGRTDRCRQRQYPFGLNGQGVKKWYDNKTSQIYGTINEMLMYNWYPSTTTFFLSKLYLSYNHISYTEKKIRIYFAC